MVSLTYAQRERIDGLATFATVGFALGLGLIFVLERVGAPDAFVQSLGPILALLALCVIGVTTRSASLPDFLAARRTAPTFYAGLAFAGSACGLAMAFLSGPAAIADRPWQGLACGVAAAALVVGPLCRRQNASAVSDVLATRFPAAPTRFAFALVLAIVGGLTAIAGFDLATHTLAAALDSSRSVARALVMLALAVSLVPGGLKGLQWSDAASGGGALLIVAIGAGVALAKSGEPSQPLAAFWSFAATGSSSLGYQAATGLGVAFFFALATPSIGTQSASRAAGAGLAGLAFLVLGLAMALLATSYFGDFAGASRTARAFAAAAAWLPALALARGGIFGVARARGLDLAVAYAKLTVLSSQRIALIRAGALIAIALCPWVADVLALDAARALDFALSIGLALVAPSLALAMALPATSLSAVAALGAALAVAAARLYWAGAAPLGPDLYALALQAGAAGFVAGAAAALIVRDRRTRAKRAFADPFIDVPLDFID